MKYIKRQPTFQAFLYDGTEESCQEIEAYARQFYKVSIDRTEYHYGNYSDNFVSLSIYDDGDHKKIVEVRVGEYAVIREDGKYYKYTEEEFQDWFRVEAY